MEVHELIVALVLAQLAYYLVLFIFDYQRGYSVTRGVPSPVNAGPFGQMPIMLRNFHRVYDYLLEQTLRFKQTWTFKTPFNARYFLVSDPQVVEFVMKTEFDAFEKGRQLNDILYDLLGKGIFASDGVRWQMQRKAASQIFHVKNFREYFMEVFQEETAILVQILGKCAKKQQTVDLYDLFNRLTLESFCRIGFGVELNLLSNILDKDDWTSVPFAVAFDNAQTLIVGRLFNGFWKVTEWLDGTKLQMQKYATIIDEFSQMCIDMRRADPEADQKHDLLSRFMRLKSDETGELLNDKELRDTVINLIIAGRDTTAQGLSWTFSELFRNQSVVTKTREEIRLVAPELSSEGPAVLDYDTTMKFNYTKAVFMEGLRLHPSVSKQGKTAINDITLPDGTQVKAGDYIGFSSYVMGHLKSVWGPDAEEFNPDRFVNDPNPSPFKFFAFNAGPRLCLGMNMAYLEALVAMTSIISKFDVEAADASEITYAHGLTLLMKNGMKVKVKQLI